MKIDGNNRALSLDAARNRKSQTASDSPAKAAPSQQGETVNLSGRARELSAARAPEVPDQGRIDRLRDAIVGGELKIDVSKIAQRMIEEEL